MTNKILHIFLLLVSLNSYSQDPEKILKESYLKCLTIKNGFYDMEMKMTFDNIKDTSWDIGYRFYFNKLKDDSLYSIAFNSERFSKGQFYIDNRLYTGNELVTFKKRDSTAMIISKKQWLKNLMNSRHNDIITFYGPFINADHKPLPQEGDYTDGRHSFKFIGTELLNNFNCYHVQMIEYPEYDSTQVSYTIEQKYDFWINTEDKIPVKYSRSSKNIEYGDTLPGFSSYMLKEYNLNNPQNLIPLQLSAIPAYCKTLDYAAPQTIPLLKNNTTAPSFTLISLQSKKVSLSDYKGRVVLIDFFYKDCPPCMKAIPVLQSLYKKYNNKGLDVLGIDPVDGESEALDRFNLKAGITYHVMQDNKDVNKDYHVSGYPTLYLIDRYGKIIYSDVGFSDTLKTKLEELVKNNL